MEAGGAVSPGGPSSECRVASTAGMETSTPGGVRGRSVGPLGNTIHVFREKEQNEKRYGGAQAGTRLQLSI